MKIIEQICTGHNNLTLKAIQPFSNQAIFQLF